MKGVTSVDEAQIEAQEGRRVYIQEQALILEGTRDHSRLEETVRFIAALTLPRNLAHAVSEIEFFTGDEVIFDAEDVISTMALRALESDFLRTLLIGPAALPRQVLEPTEQVVANCYFSNYYTLATGDIAASTMFQDNSSISDIKRVNPEGLTLIGPKDLSNAPKAKKARDWFNVGLVPKPVDSIAEEINGLLLEHNEQSHSKELICAMDDFRSKLVDRLQKMFTSLVSS